MKDFLAKVWTGVKWIWTKIVAAVVFLKDFIVWVKNRRNPE